MFSIENISKSFGSKIIFNCTNLKVNSKERVGLVGRNGHGKTTLLRIIMGKETSDYGNIVIPKNYRIGYVRQNIYFSKSSTIKEGIDSLVESEKNNHWKAKKILSGLGFSETDMKKNPNNLSGGKQIKLNLAKTLISEPDLLLLDEPTNYLDILSIKWLENFFLNWKSELILVTHNQSFMNKIVTHISGIHRKKIKKIKGDTIKFYEYIAKEEEIYEKTRLNYKKTEKRILSFVERFKSKAKLAGMVQSRIKAMTKIKKLNKLEKLKVLDFSFNNKPFRALKSLSVNNLSFAYPGFKLLFSELSFSVGINDRICIVGKNGKGKTTLLRIIAKMLHPSTGSVVYNPQVTAGVFEQNSINSLSKLRTVEEEILCANTNVKREKVREICGAMMFKGDDALKKISVLSGGEKNRVMLGKLLITPVNLLILDEPTNHLDMDSCDSLLAAIDNFKGPVIMATHNEMFLHSLAKRIIVLDGSNAHIFDESYQSFMDNNRLGDEVRKRNKLTSNKLKLSKKEMRSLRSNIVSEKSRIITPIKKNIVAIETVIKKSKIEIESLHQKLIIASQNRDKNKIKYFSCKAHNHREKTKKLVYELTIMQNKLKDIEKKFQKKLLK